MSFFKDFKEDFSQAINEMMPGDDTQNKEKELVINTLEEEVDARAELNKLEGLFEKVETPIEPLMEKKPPQPEEAVSVKEQPKPKEEPEAVAVKSPAASKVRVDDTFKKAAIEEPIIREPEDTHTAEAPGEEPEALEPIKEEAKEEIKEEIKETKEDLSMNAEEVKETVEETVDVQFKTSKEVSDEITVITEGTSLTGNINSIGSIEIRGQVNGNVECNGKLTVTGTVKGNTTSSEFFADSAKVEGEISTEGTAKIGLGSVVIGNISATSAVIAGAIKGDIDVQGPVVVDTSAVVMGNIKSRSVQINNGAVIEGFCSQCYAEVDVTKLFD